MTHRPAFPTSRPVRSLTLACGLVLLLGGCTRTVIHRVEGGFSVGERSDLDLMISTQDLGVGYDLLYTDPEDWALNSVQGSAVRPRVFEFEPDTHPSHVIDIPQLTGPPRRQILPVGIFAETSPRFEWDEDLRFVYSGRDFQNDYGVSVSASGGAPVAAFTASASFKRINQSTSEDKKSFAYKEGRFRGLTMQLDDEHVHRLTPRFREAVLAIESEEMATAFIERWGTHYTHQVTLGARCAYEMEHSYLERSSVSGSETSFEAEVSAAAGAFEVGVGAGFETNTLNTVKTASGTENINFVSFGGSGAGIDDFGLWTEHAVNNPTLVDLRLASYVDLIDERYFPELSAKRLEERRGFLQSAIDAYLYLSEEDRPKALSPEFGDIRDDGWFTVKVLSFKNSVVPDNYDPPIAGRLKLQLHDDEFEPIAEPSFYKDKVVWESSTTWSNESFVEDGAWVASNGAVKDLDFEQTFAVPAELLGTAAVSLVGQFETYWNGLTPDKTPQDVDNTVALGEVAEGSTQSLQVPFLMTGGSETVTVTADVRVERIDSRACNALLREFRDQSCQERVAWLESSDSDFFTRYSERECALVPFFSALQSECDHNAAMAGLQALQRSGSANE